MRCAIHEGTPPIVRESGRAQHARKEGVSLLRQVRSPRRDRAQQERGGHTAANDRAAGSRVVRNHSVKRSMPLSNGVEGRYPKRRSAREQSA
jgi:hypothetical protein